MNRSVLKNIFCSVILFSFSNAYSQVVNPVVKATLPAVLNESSGVEVINRNNIWSHNDGSGNAELYNFDSTGTLLRTLVILNAANVDWEDLARDTLGNFFIGDFGNNNNDRQDLKIYIIPDPSIIIGDSVLPQVINYTYPDQVAFPPADSLKNFDCEAMIAMNDSLYLFSKDQSNPYSGYTKLYSLPATAGTYVANLLDSFYTGPGPAIAYSVTSADISPDQSRLVLLGYNRIWMFSNFTGTNFFSGTIQQFTISSLTQKEGICFITNSEVYITDELAFGIGQKLYYLDFTPYVTATTRDEIKNNLLIIYPNPAKEKIRFKYKKAVGENPKLKIVDAFGRLIQMLKITNPEEDSSIEIDTSHFKNGIYYVALCNDKTESGFVKMVISR